MTIDQRLNALVVALASLLFPGVTTPIIVITLLVDAFAFISFVYAGPSTTVAAFFWEFTTVYIISLTWWICTFFRQDGNKFVGLTLINGYVMFNLLNAAGAWPYPVKSMVAAAFGYLLQYFVTQYKAEPVPGRDR
ncbi:hypothetical protein H9P43_004906 [Blastocladiella emersonii ATCC 22665]|nr:hypothetical protein H9P43_004906 [Blastocladiella emersonii ATCC 22665]